jgi:two-component system, cell cycle sensor histidine kinase and response regulator CckA
MYMQKTETLLIIEENPVDARLVIEVLRKTPNIKLHIKDGFASAMEYIASHRLDAVILDIGLPDSQGLASLKDLAKSYPDMPIIVLTGNDDRKLAQDAIRLGAQDYLIKPVVMEGMLERTLHFAVERKQFEKSLRERDVQYMQLHESMMDGFFHVDMQGRFVHWNSAFESMLAYSKEELSELTDRELTPGKWQAYDAKIVDEQVLPRGYSDVYEKEFYSKDGIALSVELRTSLLRDAAGMPAGMWSIVRNLTDRKLLQRQFLQSQKMEGIGRLAGGIAHDFNNLLTVILGNCQLLLDSFTPDNPARFEIEQIRDAGERAASLTSKLLAFSRKQMLQLKIFNINDLIKDSTKLLRRLIGEDIELVTILAPDLACIKADMTQIEQIVFNLAINSKDAMPHGGRLEFETASAEMDALFVKKHPGSRLGKYVMIAIRDTGTGMDAETKNHVFEPFFTTKEMGKGTGLGLATVYGIVKQSDGYITIDSELGQGTSVCVYLPRIDAAPDRERKIAPAETEGSGVILLVEDSDDVRRFAVRCLEIKGYTVFEAKDAISALAIAEKLGGQIDLLITDMILTKGLNGLETANELRSRYPKIKMLLISGYSEQLVANELSSPELKILPKPFSAQQLAMAAKEVLQGIKN